MIFKRLFTPQHTHSDPAVRINAIAKLDPQATGDKSKLHELAFNDADGEVSLAALEKLKSFPLWLKMSQIAANNKVKKQAHEKVLAILTDEQSELIAPALKRATVLESKDTGIVRYVLEHTTMFSEEPEVISELLTRIGDDAFLRQYLIEKASPEVRSFLIAGLDDIEALTKLNRNAALEDHKLQIEQRITVLRVKQQRPIRLKETLRLNLSKYKALTEKSDYAAIATKGAELRLSIEGDIAELGEYEPEIAHSLEQKYSKISSSVDSALARLYPSYQAQQESLAKQESLSLWQEQGAAVIQLVTELMQQQTERQYDELNQYVAEVRQSINDLLVDEVCTELDPPLAKELLGLDAKLELLPRFQIAQEQINAIVATFNRNYQLPQELADYDASKTVFEALKLHVKDVLAQFDGELLEELQGNWPALRKEWQKALKVSQNKADELMRMCQSKLRAAQGLYKDGKFKAVLAVDKKISAAIGELPQTYIDRIQRQLDSHQAIIAELTDWQVYVAAPRLPELITKMQALAAQPAEDIEERRRQIQLLRKNWNSLQLGHRDRADSLKQDFDNAADQAFAPVKQHQDEQNIIRANNKAQAESLLQELEKLDPNAADKNGFTKQFNRLNQRWFALGEVGRSEWQELKHRYTAVSKPLKQSVATVHKANAEQKARLIKQAETLLQESTSDIVAQVKALQQQWQEIGFAGSKQDQSLWKTFRSVNDQVFSQLKQQKQSLQNSIDSAFNNASEKFAALRENIERENLTAGQLSALSTGVESVLSDFRDAVDDLDSSLVRRALQQLKRLGDELSEKIKKRRIALEKDKVQTQIRQLFDYLQNRVGEEQLLGRDAPSLPGITLRTTENKTLTRHIITVRMEIITESDSPRADSELRSQQQVQLMSDKLTSGELADKWQLFALWMACGPLIEEELALLQRVRVILIPESAEGR